MFNFRFKLIVVRLLYAILELNVGRCVLNPDMPHRWSGVLEDAGKLIEDLGAQVEDLERFVVKPEVEQCDDGGESKSETPQSIPSEDE